MQPYSYSDMQENLHLDTLGLTSTVTAVGAYMASQLMQLHPFIQAVTPYLIVTSATLAVVSWSVRIYKDSLEIKRAKSNGKSSKRRQ